MRAGEGHTDVSGEGGAVVDVIGGEGRPAPAVEVQGAEGGAGGEQPIADDAEQPEVTGDLWPPLRPALVGGQVVARHGGLESQGVQARALVQLVLQRVDRAQRGVTHGVAVDAVTPVDDAHPRGVAPGHDSGGELDCPFHGLLGSALVMHLARGVGQFVIKPLGVGHGGSMPQEGGSKGRS